MFLNKTLSFKFNTNIIQIYSKYKIKGCLIIKITFNTKNTFLKSHIFKYPSNNTGC